MEVCTMNTRDLTKEEAEVISMEEYLAKRKKIRKKTQEKRIRRSRRKSDASGILYGIIACMVVILVRVIVAGKLKYQRISV